MFKLKGSYGFATGTLFALGLFSLLNGLFHFLWYDSGAGSVMGADLSGPAGHSLVFMLAVVGQLQIFKGLVYLWVAMKEKPYILGAFCLECISNILALYLHYGPKHPDPLAPHRFINVVFLAVCLVMIVLINIGEKKRGAYNV